VSNQVSRFDDLFHQWLDLAKFDQPDRWFPRLKGISMIDLHTLRLLHQNPGIIMGDIREHLGIPHSTLTSVVDRLEQRGLVRRTISPRDRRSFRLEMTEMGALLQQDHRAMDRMHAQVVLASLDTDEEREQFITLLEKIVSRIPGAITQTRGAESEPEESN